LAATCVAATFSALLWARPLRTPRATGLLTLGIWTATFAPLPPLLFAPGSVGAFVSLHAGLLLAAVLASYAWVLHAPRPFGKAAAVGELALFVAGLLLVNSNFALAAAHVLFNGVLFGFHLRRSTPEPFATPQVAQSFPRDDAAIFALATALSSVVSECVFGRVVINGDEIANSFQANLFAHLRAYAPVPPCPSMFQNYWVFRVANRLFAQYTPGWPLFMAPFERAHVIWLAGPVMSGIFAVGVARLSRRAARALDAGPEDTRPLTRLVGVIGPALALLGPSMLMNAASRFPHVMTCACFAWATEAACVVTTPETSRRRTVVYGGVLGAALSLGLATRPVDGALLALGVLGYGTRALAKGRVRAPALFSSALVALVLLGLTAVILRLQLGTWFKTGYSLAPSVHPEAMLRFSWPGPRHIKDSIPLDTGSYCWWPAAPALGAAGLASVFRGRERRVPLMLCAGAAADLAFYFWIEFGRRSDNALGPRYHLPLVVPMAVGGACLLAPLFLDFVRATGHARTTAAGPALVSALALIAGVLAIAPLIYPVAHAEYHAGTAPLRGARAHELRNAVVLIEPDKVIAPAWNLAQNAPMDPAPDVLFLIRHNQEDDACARANFPGRTFYRASRDETLLPY
jgi:hypothetical protein